MTLLDRLTARPERALVALCIVQFVLWTVAPGLSHTAMPLDMVEMYVWGREWVVATFKHPNLPGLMLEAARTVTGSLPWTGFAVSQICIVLTYGAVFVLGRDMLGARKALAGTLLLTGIYYFSWSSPEMNHNVAQMPLWALVIGFLWRAVERGGPGWWIGLGLLGGLSLWAKYSSAVLLLICLVWLFADARARAHLRRPGPWLALAAFAAMAAPQMLFLLETDFLSLRYAQDRAAGTAGHWVGFLPTQIANHAVMFIMLAVAGLFGRGALARPDLARPGDPMAGGEARARRFLVVFGLGPVLLTVAAAAITGSGLKDMWGMPMFTLSGLLALAFLPGRFAERSLRRIAVFAACLLVILPAAYAAHLLLAGSYRDRPKRGNWPQQEIAATLLDAYRTETGIYPDIVAGPIWEAGLVATGTSQAPSVLIDGDPQKSLWLSAADISRRGMLVVWNSNRAPPEALAERLATAGVQRAQFRWSDDPEAEIIALDYVILPPDGG